MSVNLEFISCETKDKDEWRGRRWNILLRYKRNKNSNGALRDQAKKLQSICESKSKLTN